MKHLSLLTLLLFVFAFKSVAQDSDEESIQKVARNFMIAWYDGNSELMESTLQEDAVSKVVTSAGNRSRLEFYSALELVQLTRNGGGKAVPKEERKMDISVLDQFQNAATVKIQAYDAIEYLHMAKWRGEWKIINILFERIK